MATKESFFKIQLKLFPQDFQLIEQIADYMRAKSYDSKSGKTIFGRKHSIGFTRTRPKKRPKKTKLQKIPD